MHKISVGITASLLLFALACHAAVSSDAASAIAGASKAGQFICLVFYEATDASLTAMTSSIATYAKTAPKKLSVCNVKASDPANQDLVTKYGIKTADLPIVLVMAPNGVVTGGSPKTVTADQLKQFTTISDLMLRVIKPLQEQKVALVALQNATTKFNAESWAGVSEFANDPQYKQFVAAVKADPSATGSQDFVKQCQLIAPISEATVVILMPPGKIGKVLTGKLTKADVLKALGSCATGCAPGGCSDRRFKQSISPIASALDMVTKLQGVTFAWNTKDFPRRFFTADPQIGVIAQDVETVIPEVVHTDKEGFKSVEYDKLTAVLIEAVKEMNIKLVAQDSLIIAQNARIKALEAK